jgi:hypothetical protein
MAKKASTPKTEAQKAAKWVELAEKRAEKIVRGIESLGKLSAKSRYSYTPKQIEKLESIFEDALKECFSRYAGTIVARGGIDLK